MAAATETGANWHLCTHQPNYSVHEQGTSQCRQNGSCNEGQSTPASLHTAILLPSILLCCFSSSSSFSSFPCSVSFGYWLEIALAISSLGEKAQLPHLLFWLFLSLNQNGFWIYYHIACSARQGVNSNFNWFKQTLTCKIMSNVSAVAVARPLINMTNSTWIL